MKSTSIKKTANFFTAFLFFIQFSINAQNILISTGGTVNVNGGEIFYDAGGAAGNDGNTSYTITLCPAVAGEAVALDFTYFKTMFDGGPEDPLFIYDAATVSGLNIGKLMGDYSIKTGNATSPYGVGRGLTNSADPLNIFKPTIFSATNSTGCLTLVFSNADPSQNPGWVADVKTFKPLGVPGCSISLTPLTSTICSGQTITLTATGSLVSSSLNNNFNGSIGSGWLGTPSASIVTNVCASPSLDGSQYLWMQNSAVPRSLESLPMNVLNGGTISFEYRQAKYNSDPSPCEAPDVLMSGTTNEGVFVQYSTNGGATWSTFKYLFSNSLYSNSGTADAYNNGCGDYVTRWTKMTYPIPTAAKTASTKFRWIQPAGTSASTDNWGLDNLTIATPNTSTITIRNVTTGAILGTSTVSPFSINASPTVTTVYEASITDGITTCINQQTITVNGGTSPVTSFSYSNTHCQNASNPTPTLASGFTTGGSFSSTPVGLSLNATSGLVNLSATNTGTYMVTYTVAASGCGVASNSSTTLSIIATPTVTALSSTICPGGSATLTANGGTSYTWSPSATLSSPNGSVVTSTPGANIVYSIIGTNGTCTSSATSSVTIGAGISVTSTPATICAGSNTVLIANGGTSYTWSPAATLSSANGTTVTATPTTNTTYTITGLTGACSGSTTILVTVNPAPTITVNNPTICPGGSATLTAGGATTFSWTAGLSSASGTSVNGNPIATTVYTVTGTTSGCSATKTTTITVSPSPTITVNNSTVCPGGSATLTANGATSYTWSPSATLSSPNGSVVISTPGANSVYTIIGSNGTCTSSATSSVTIGAGISISAAPASICIGSNTVLTANGGTTYTWSPSATLSSANGTTVTATPTTNTTYTVTGLTGACSGSTTVLVTVNASPTVTVNNPTICPSGSAILTASGATTYSWSAGLSSTNGSTVNANPLSSTIYTVTGTTSGCSSTKTVSVTVTSNPTITVNNSTICPGGSATLTANGAASYTWSPSNTLSAANGSVVTSSPGSNIVYTIIGSNGTCTSSATSSVTVGSNLSLTSTAASICVGQATTLTVNGGATYTWSPSASLSSSNSSTVIATPTANTTYTIIGQSGICTGSTTVNVSVNSNPTITVNNPTICTGSSAVLTANGATTYSWNNGATTQTINVSPITQTNYTVTGTINGCNSNTVSVVNLNLTPTLSANSQTICPGNTTTLTASGATTYSWNNGATTSTISVSPIIATSYTVTGFSNGCSSTMVTNVGMNPTPTLTVNNPTLCSGSSSVLTASGATNYTWSTGATTQTISVSPTTNISYTVSGGQTGCLSTTIANVTIQSLPNITVNTLTLCSGSSGTLTASGATTYSWSTGETTSSASVLGLTTGTYNVIGTTAGCSNTLNTTVSVTPTPTLITSSDVSIISGTQTTLNVNGGTSYTWTPSGTLSCSNCNSPIASPTVNTQYCVSSNEGTCLTTKCINVDVETACYSNTDYATPSAFTPNGDGVNDCYNLNGWAECTTTFYISIYNRWGEMVFSSDDVSFCWDGLFLGKPLDSAVFVYYIKAEIAKVGNVTKKGNITLIR